MTAAAWPTARSTTTEKAATVTAFVRRALDWFLDHGIVAERLMTDSRVAWRPSPDRGGRADAGR
jgi:hypothetical protein